MSISAGYTVSAEGLDMLPMSSTVPPRVCVQRDRGSGHDQHIGRGVHDICDGRCDGARDVVAHVVFLNSLFGNRS